jgi:hypothetical protein
MTDCRCDAASVQRQCRGNMGSFCVNNDTKLQRSDDILKDSRNRLFRSVERSFDWVAKRAN